MDIDAKSKTWSALVNSEDVKYYIPNYQRYYSWTRNKELPELWSDLIAAFKNKTTYFMGTLLFSKKSDGNFDVVDGQQRMLSFTILFSVIRDYALLSRSGVISDSQLNYQSEGIKDKSKFVSDFIYDSTRTLQRSSDESYFVVANKDKDSFDKIIDGAPEVETSSGKTSNRIIKAKYFFQREIQQEFFNKSGSLNKLSEFQQFISKKIKFVSIVVEDEFDAYTIFESLNSKGMDLSLADLLKNKILSSISQDDQNDALVRASA